MIATVPLALLALLALLTLLAMTRPGRVRPA